MITLFYDDSCTLCTTNAVQMQKKNIQKITIIPVDKALDILTLAHITREEAMTYVCVQDETGKMYKGMDAIRLLYQVAGVRFTPILKLPIIKQISDACYPLLAKNRYYFPKWAIRLLYGEVVTSRVNDCDNNICKIPPKKR